MMDGWLFLGACWMAHALDAAPTPFSTGLDDKAACQVAAGSSSCKVGGALARTRRLGAQNRSPEGQRCGAKRV